MNLSPLTILIGPPGSGKSNILDAIALLGYPTRLYRQLVGSEYGGNLSNIEPLRFLVRISEPTELFNYKDVRNKIKIEIKIGDKTSDLQLAYDRGSYVTSLNEISIIPDLASFLTSQQLEPLAEDLMEQAETMGYTTVEARLYSYDRCGFHFNYLYLLPNITVTHAGSMMYYGYYTLVHFSPNIFQALLSWLLPSKNFPASVLSELGLNIHHIAKIYQEAINKLNNVLRESFEEKVEVIVTEDRISIADYGIKFVSPSVSESILRALYYTLAIHSFTQYSEKHKFKGRSFLLLEEPESHMFPYLFDYLAELIVEAAKTSVTVVIATHNPLLVSGLWDKMKGVSTYYVFRSPEDGSTSVVELDIEKMAEDIITPEDIMFRSVREVIERYAKKSSDTG